MNAIRMSEEIDHTRRRFLGAARLRRLLPRP